MAAEPKSSTLKPQKAAGVLSSFRRTPTEAMRQTSVALPEPLALLQRAQARPTSISTVEAAHLQHTVGNQALGRFLQPKLTLGAAGDKYEREADRTAEQVMGSIAASHAGAQNTDLARQSRANALATLQRVTLKSILARPQLAASAQTSRWSATSQTTISDGVKRIQRADLSPEEELQASPLHGLAGGDVDAEVAGAIEHSKGGGAPLHRGVRSAMERGFGADFSGVRVHTDVQAATLNRSLNARAFTTGRDIFFGKGQYSPDSSAGQKLIAHELTHTVQQGATKPGVSSIIQRVMQDHGKKGFNYLVSMDKGEAPPPETDEWKYIRLPGQDKNYGDREVYKREKNIKRVKSPAEIEKEAWDDLEKSLGAYGLYHSPAKGTFEYVAQYLFESMEDKDRDQRRRQLYEYVSNQWQPKKLSDSEKRQHLTEMMNLSLTLYDSDDPENQKKGVGALSPTEIQGAAREKKVEAPELVPSIPESVAVGFHGTNQSMDIVAAKKGEKVSTSTDFSGATTQKGVGWGGLQRSKDLSFKKKEYALDETWNPLKEQLDKGAHYRKGKNWDNELLSTVSVATHPTPSIKFPFPSGSGDRAKTYLYAVIVQEAYPTFKIQSPMFPEIAVKEIAPENIIGVTMVDKHYAPSVIADTAKTHKLNYTPKKDAEQNHETFAYRTYGFKANPKLATKWGKASAKAITDTAQEKVEGEIGKAYRWGIYHDMKIAK